MGFNQVLARSFALFLFFFWVLLPGDVYSKGLSHRLNGLFGGNGLWMDVEGAPNPFVPGTFFPSHSAHFSSDSLARLGLLVQQLAPSAADFPALSTAPGFT